MRLKHLLLALSILPLGLMAPAQEPAKPSFDEASVSVDQRLQQAIEELNTVRQQSTEEKLPLSRELSRLEGELVSVRLAFQSTSRLLDTRTLDLANLRNEIKTRQTESTYLTNLLSEFSRKFESRIHIAEVARYRTVIADARLALENSALSTEQVYAAQADVLEASLARLEEALGGTSFDGTAVDPTGAVLPGTFVMLGNAALFQSKDGTVVGTAEQRLGSLEPAVIPLSAAIDTSAAKNLVTKGTGFFPFDPTLGNAHKIEDTEDTLIEHITKGGPVMYPIFILAGLALLVSLWKALGFLIVRNPNRARLKALLAGMAKHDDKALVAATKAMMKPDPLREWMVGAGIGAVLGALTGWFVAQDFRDPLFIQISATIRGVVDPGSVFGYTILYAIIGAVLELGLRFAFGYSPVGRMLQAGVEHLGEPTELVEEVMYEKMLEAKLKLESMLPFIAVSASAAPLLGLLGTVTGIINTFNLITVYGSGDVKTLSSGISEALITTEYGLIVAIPSLLIHGLLSRRAKAIAGAMEQAAVAFMNQLAKSPYGDSQVIVGGPSHEDQINSLARSAAEPAGKN